MIRGAKLLNKNKICKVLCVKNKKKSEKKNYKKNREYAASGWKIVHSEGGVRLQVHWAQNRTHATRPARTYIENRDNVRRIEALHITTVVTIACNSPICRFKALSHDLFCFRV